MPQGAAALVIPAWNEPDAIGAVLQEIPPQTVDDVIVVVGSAQDPTATVAARQGARVLVQHTRGYGAACWTGAQHAVQQGASIVAFLDGDYSDPPSALPRLLAPIQTGEADLVLGWRDLRRFPRALPAHARLGNWTVCAALNFALGRHFRDLPSFKAIRAESLRTLDMHEMTYGWTVEMLAKAVRRGLRIQQVPVEYRPRLGGQSKVSGNPRASLAAAYKLLSCALSYSL